MYGRCVKQMAESSLDMLLRLEDEVPELEVNSFNKRRRPLFFSSYKLACFFSAGQGGEGGERICSAAAAIRSWCLFSSCFDLVFSHGTGRLRPNLSYELLRMEKEEMASAACSFHKRVCCVPSGMFHVFLLLADRGGEGEDGDVVATGLCWRIGWWWCEFDATSTASLVMSSPTSSSLELHWYLSGCRTLYPLLVTVHVGCAFLLFGTGWRRVRSSLLRFLRFNSQDPRTS